MSGDGRSVVAGEVTGDRRPRQRHRPPRKAFDGSAAPSGAAASSLGAAAAIAPPPQRPQSARGPAPQQSAAPQAGQRPQTARAPPTQPPPASQQQAAPQASAGQKRRRRGPRGHDGAGAADGGGRPRTGPPPAAAAAAAAAAVAPPQAYAPPAMQAPPPGFRPAPPPAAAAAAATIPAASSAGTGFAGFGLHPLLMQGIQKMGYVEPTDVQKQTIPAAVQGRDILAAAATGSGKTAAFLLPVLHRLLHSSNTGTQVLILTPTRELAAQIHDNMQELGGLTRLRGHAVFGGVAQQPQVEAFRRGVEVIIACPGRLLDHMRSGDYARMPNLDYLILDEADRMLDMGFMPQIRAVLAALPQRPRQTLFFSATMPGPIIGLAGSLVHNPVRCNLEREAAPAEGITHAVYAVSESRKSALLLALIKAQVIQTAIIFTRTKHRANRLALLLEKQGVVCHRIHGNRSQAQRTEALADFKEGRVQFMVATDVLQRGIDVEELEHVVNFDVPHVSEDYIHRVGRTARAERKGDAVTFVAPEEEGDLRAIERAIGFRIDRFTLPGFDYTAQVKEQLEVPLAERIAAIRKEKAEQRERSRAKAERRQQQQPSGGRPPTASAPGTSAAGAPHSRQSHQQQQPRRRPATAGARPATAGASRP